VGKKDKIFLILSSGLPESTPVFKLLLFSGDNDEDEAERIGS
jgi:hypothetical protein